MVGRRPNRHVFFFLLDDGWLREELDFALNTVRAALGSRLTDARVRGSFQQAAEIQQSLLEEPPDFPGFDIACRSVPAEEVGGDFYDFHAFDGEMLGLAIGDASGHGLPAALLVRDVVTGLRMGIEKELKIATVFAKLNRVIHRSNLSSRFICVFYGELEADGNLIYVNAGHPPPLLFFRDPKRGTGELELKLGRDRDRPPARGGVPARLRPRAAGRGAGALHGRHPGAAGRPAASSSGRTGCGRSCASTRTQSGGGDPGAALRGRPLRFGDGRPWEDDATAVIVKRRPEA